MEELTIIGNFISGVGFPVVAAYFMYKFANSTIKENTEAITELKQMMVEIKAILMVKEEEK